MANYIVSSGEVSSGIILNSYDSMTVFGGGIADSTTVNTRGYLYVSSGGTAKNTVVNGSRQKITGGGYALYNGYLYVGDGATANETTVNFIGIILVSAGGVANNTTVNSSGSLYVSSGGTANCTVISSGGTLCVSSGGVANNTTVNSGVWLYISNGGTVNNTTVNSGVWLYISNGGTANHTAINSGGIFFVSSGGVANNTTVNSGGGLCVSSGGTAGISFNPWQGSVASDNGAIVSYFERDAGVYYGEQGRFASKADVMDYVTITSGNSLIVYSGGTANSTTVDPYGFVQIYEGGSATDLIWTPCVGTLWIEDGACVTFVSQYEGVYYGNGRVLFSSAMIMENISVGYKDAMYLMANGMVNSTTIASGGSMYVSNGGTANNTIISSSGFLRVTSGGSTAHVEVASGALLDISIAPDTYIEGTYVDSAFEVKGGSATYYSVNSGNILRISSGGVASRAYVYAGGSLFVSNGGTASRTTVNNGTMNVLSGGVADSTTVNGGYLHVSSGGIARNITNNGSVIVSSGASIDTVNVKNECWLYVSSGGTATNITASSTKLCFVVAPDTFIAGTSNGSSFEIKNGIVSDYGVNQSGWLNILSGCTANNITVNLSGFMGVEGIANSVIIHGSGYVTVSSGGLVNSVTVNSYGRMDVSRGTVNYAAVNGGKYCYVSVFSGTANYATVNEGSMYVSYGAANYATVNGGYMRVFSGTADNAIVNGGSMYIVDGAASNVSVSKGTLRLNACTISDTKIYSGGIVSTQQTKFTGTITIADGGVIHAGQGTVIDFDISRLAPNMGALLNNLSLIQDDAPAFTLTVSDLQWNGTYKLAQGVTEFDNIISVKSTASQTIHMVAVDETVNVDGIEYTLKLTDGTLFVTVTGGRDIPIVPVSADITEFTNQDVTLTAEFSENAIMREYSFDNDTWYVYTEPVKCEVNGTAYFLGKDQRGFVNEIATYEVTNIDKMAPTVTNITPSTTEPADSVTVTADFADDVALASKLYKIGYGTWMDYPSEGVTVNENTTVYFKAVDKAGNETTEFYVVTNIETSTADITAPTVSNITASTTSPTNQPVILTADYADDIELASSLYRIGENGEWQDYVDGVTVTENTTVFFKAVDSTGNVSAEVSYTVGNIDKVAPSKPTATADITSPTNQDVTVTATFSADSVVKEYSTDGQTWKPYTKAVVLTANGIISFRGLDEAGNASEIETYEVTNIDKTKPVIELSADTETVLKQTTLTATVDDGSEIYFRISEFGLWKKYTGPIIASFNETYYFKATDEARNEGTNQITFGNIDTTGILLSTLWTQRGVCPMGGNTTVCYDEYTPYDPSVTPDTHSLVGCVNVAVGQLIYYFIEKQGLDLALTLKDSDEYKSSHSVDEGDPIVIEIKSDGKTPGTLSFAKINEYLSSFQLDSAEHAAALLYACGVVHKSKYAAASTGASWKKSTFTRSGFKCVNTDGPYMGMGYYYWGYWDDDFKIHISDAGYEVLIENLEAGRSVGAAYHGHALVIDGYDRETDTFHINFGWGYNQATRWYTREGIFELQLFDFVYDLMVDYVETFTVTDARLYGTGTMLRAFEQASGMAGANTVIFDSSVAGKTVELENNIKVTDETTVNGFNMNVLVTSVFTDELPAYGICSDEGGILTFHASGGSLIVSTSNEYTHAFDMSDASSGTVTADGMLIYAGKNSEGADAAAVLHALQTCQSENAEVSEDLLDPNGWSFYGSTGNDVFSLSNFSIAVGNVSLGDGDDVLSLTDHSRLYGTIDAGDGNDSITVDSTSSISGDLSGKSKLNFVLAERDDHVMFTVKNSVSDLYSNAILSVDITDAGIGTYTLVSTAPGASGIEDLQNMVFTVTGSGAPDFTLSINGTSTSNFADLICEGNSLKLQVKIGSSIVKPQTQTWEEIEGATQYIVEYSMDNFEHVIQVAVDSNSLDSFQMPAGSYQMRVKPEGGEWTEIEPVVAPEAATEPKQVKSNEDGNEDLFFASANGTWESNYFARHVGSVNDWTGTNEIISANGKGRIQNIFFGSTDPNMLCLTDRENGDAIFVDDVYTGLPEGIEEHTARLYRIQEVRAGFGDDIVDMTSQRFEYIGDGLTIRGGAGNDTIWSNKGDNMLFGDAGNDRIVGASGNDVIAGGIGNDRMHGGGGSDIFTFGENWGVDNVEQLATGSVMLWFASGSEANWNAETLTYTDGDNSVTVKGVTPEQITLKFGDDGSDLFATLSGMGAFFDATSERIFEESGKGMLAGL